MLEINNDSTASPATSGQLSGTSKVTVSTGGTLLLSGSATVTDRINNSATMTLNGGTFNTGGLSERSGTLTVQPGIGAWSLQSNSIINMGSLSSVLAFANSNTTSTSALWTSGQTLSIYNWTGTPRIGHGVDQLYFGTDTTGLTQNQLDSVKFYSDSGTTLLGTGVFSPIGDGEIVPVPEPSTWAAGILTVAALGYSQRRRVLRLLSFG